MNSFKTLECQCLLNYNSTSKSHKILEFNYIFKMAKKVKTVAV